MSHMTQTANPVTLLASPLGEEGHKVAKGVQANWIHRGAPRPANPVIRHPAKSVWTVVILIMILDVDVTAEGGIIKLIAPSRGNERYEGKKASHILHVPFRRFPPLVVNAVSQSPECLTCHMIQKANPVTLTLINLRRSRHHNPRAKGPSNLRTLRPSGRSNLRTLFQNPLNPHTEGVSDATTTLFPLFFHKQGPM